MSARYRLPLTQLIFHIVSTALRRHALQAQLSPLPDDIMQASPDAADSARLTGRHQSFLLDETFNGDEGTTAAHDERSEVPPSLSAQDQLVDLKRPALSSEELADVKVKKREAALRRERDDLAKFNTLLERAIVSFESAIPKAVVRVNWLFVGSSQADVVALTGTQGDC